MFPKEHSAYTMTHTPRFLALLATFMKKWLASWHLGDRPRVHSGMISVAPPRRSVTLPDGERTFALWKIMNMQQVIYAIMSAVVPALNTRDEYYSPKTSSATIELIERLASCGIRMPFSFSTVEPPFWNLMAGENGSNYYLFDATFGFWMMRVNSLYIVIPFKHGVQLYLAATSPGFKYCESVDDPGMVKQMNRTLERFALAHEFAAEISANVSSDSLPYNGEFDPKSTYQHRLLVLA